MQAPDDKPLIQRLDHLSAPELRRLLAAHLTKQKLGLYWERDAITHDRSLNADVVLPELNESLSHAPDGCTEHRNLIIEGDNFDSLRLLRSTHKGKVRVIYIDPPYNTGNKDWVYNDRYTGAKDRWRHSQWLEFLYQRLTLARELLTSDGVILVSINDENRSRLEMLMDEVFPGRRVGSFVWKVRSGGNDTGGALLSINHEHVLVYANPDFSFEGEARDEDAFKNPDNDTRGAWSNDNLVKAHNSKQRPEAYYPIHNPDTDTWYACDPDSVWRFASTSRPSKKELAAAPMETQIAEKRILWPEKERVALYRSLVELEQAVNDGTAPKQLKIYKSLEVLEELALSDARVARLLTYIEPLSAWIGRKIGYGKPRYKRFRKDLNREVTPLSSWLHPKSDGVWEHDLDDEAWTLTVGSTGEGTAQYKSIMSNKDFPYPKPLSLIKGLLAQASRPDDIVLDFFAGSGTTGQAVLDLNAEIGGRRRFILCSSTEATEKEPTKNLCRDVCAERLRRVIDGHVGSEGFTPEQGGEFAYLQLTKLDFADVPLDGTPDQAAIMLAMRNVGATPVSIDHSDIRLIAKTSDWLLLICPSEDQAVLERLVEIPRRHGVQRLIVYARRPKSLASFLSDRGIEAQVHAISDALTQGQGGRS